MEKAEAYDERFEEVGWGRTTCEGGEQGSASFCGVAGGKGLNQGESGLPKHVPNPVSGKRATGGGPDTESFCRQSPEVGAGWFNDHVRICAGGAQQCAFLPQPGRDRELRRINRIRAIHDSFATDGNKQGDCISIHCSINMLRRKSSFNTARMRLFLMLIFAFSRLKRCWQRGCWSRSGYWYNPCSEMDASQGSRQRIRGTLE